MLPNDYSRCTNEECPLDCQRFQLKQDMQSGQYFIHFSFEKGDDGDVYCNEQIPFEKVVVPRDTNSFGSPCTTKSEYFLTLHQLHAQYEEGKMTEEQANKTLLLACFEFFSNDSEALAEFRKLSLETLSDDYRLINDVMTYLKKEGLDIQNSKIKAIKEIRRITGWGLKVSKLWIEEHMAHITVRS